MKTLQDERFSKAIQQNLEESPFYGYAQRVIDALKGEKIYFWGGAVRDPIVDVLYGLDYETRDFDKGRFVGYCIVMLLTHSKQIWSSYDEVFPNSRKAG